MKKILLFIVTAAAALAQSTGGVGLMPIGRGGTGADNITQARQNLGIYGLTNGNVALSADGKGVVMYGNATVVSNGGNITIQGGNTGASIVLDQGANPVVTSKNLFRVKRDTTTAQINLQEWQDASGNIRMSFGDISGPSGNVSPALKVVGTRGLLDDVEFAMMVNVNTLRDYGTYLNVENTSTIWDIVQRWNGTDTTRMRIQPKLSNNGANGPGHIVFPVGFVGIDRDIGGTDPVTPLDVAGTAASPNLGGDNGISTVTASTTSQLQIGGYTAAGQFPNGMWIQTKLRTNSGSFVPLAINPIGGLTNIGVGGESLNLPIGVAAASAGAYMSIYGYTAASSQKQWFIGTNVFGTAADLELRDGTGKGMRIAVATGDVKPDGKLITSAGGDSVDLQCAASASAGAYVNTSGRNASNVLKTWYTGTNIFGTSANYEIRDGSNNGITIDVDSGNFEVSGNALVLHQSYTPPTSTTAGTAGTITWDTNYVYVCVATNTWKRAALTTW